MSCKAKLFQPSFFGGKDNVMVKLTPEILSGNAKMSCHIRGRTLRKLLDATGVIWALRAQSGHQKSPKRVPGTSRPPGPKKSPQTCDSQFFNPPKRDSRKRGSSSGTRRGPDYSSNLCPPKI